MDIELLKYLGSGAFAYVVLYITYNFLLNIKNRNNGDKLQSILIKLTEIQSNIMSILERLQHDSSHNRDCINRIEMKIEEIQNKIRSNSSHK